MSGKKIVLARFIRNGRLAGALHRQAQSALIALPGAHACYDGERDRRLDHDVAARRTRWALASGYKKRPCTM